MLIAEPARPFFNRARNAECLLLALFDVRAPAKLRAQIHNRHASATSQRKGRAACTELKQQLIVRRLDLPSVGVLVAQG
jgi:hypothetical protein